MSSIKHRLVQSGGGVLRTERMRGEAKFRAVASSNNETRSGKPLRRPDSTILNEAILLFAIGRNRSGLWVARDCDGNAGDVFLSKGAAIRFAQRTSGFGGCALMFVANGLELDQSSKQADPWHVAVKVAIAAATTATKRRVKELFERSTRRNRQRELIESGLYGNKYRYRSKSDDDLPIVP
jgi:RNase P protein component